MATKRFIELSVNWVEREDNLSQSEANPGTSRTMGYLQWDADDLGRPPVERLAVDITTIELMRAYVERHDMRHAALKSRIAEARKLDRTDGIDIARAMSNE
jgi:hypothetical protein